MFRRLKRPPRLATLCVRGDVVKQSKGNAQRIELLRQVTMELRELADWHPIDAIVLPGGFFSMEKPFGASTFAERRQMVSSEEFGRAIRSAIGSLRRDSPGLGVFTGVLAASEEPAGPREQVCLAFDQTGLVAAARKIFPTAQDAHGGISTFVADYSSPRRFLALANGSVASASACYDLFGLADRGQSSTRRAAIRQLLTDEGPIKLGDVAFPALRKACLAAWATQLDEQQPDVAVATIHRFAYPGTDGYWQRHGIARASAALDGALVVGAAHFRMRLPHGSASSLAAHGVGLDHLFAGVARPACRLAPIRSHLIQGPAGQMALLRLFTPPTASDEELMP